eukprot:Gb_26796 [translate_table: standard]
MATQAGLGVSKILVLVGAGVTGSVILKSGRMSDILSELQSMLTRLDEARESSNGNSDNSSALAAQVRRLAQEVRQLAASRPITVLNGNSGQSGSLASLAVPVAALGAIGYGYMWWKGLSFSDLMYVTKRNMANVVTSVTKQLEQVSAALAATKRHLTQRIENLDGKMDEQKELSKLIKSEVVDVRGDLSQIGFDIEEIQKMVIGLETKIGTLEDKQDFANAGVWYLCQFVGGAKDGRMTEFLQNIPAKASLKRAGPAITEDKSLKGLQYIADTIQSGSIEKTKVNAVLQNEMDVMASKNNPTGATKIHKSFTNGRSLARAASTEV